MYAVVQTGGKQYKVRQGQTVLVEKLDGADAVGNTIEFDQVLLVGQDDNTLVGQPTVAGAVVTAEVLDPDSKGKKLIIFKYKSKVRYRRKTGHRQHYTKVQIKDILIGGEALVAAAVAVEA